MVRACRSNRDDSNTTAGRQRGQLRLFRGPDLYEYSLRKVSPTGSLRRIAFIDYLGSPTQLVGVPRGELDRYGRKFRTRSMGHAISSASLRSELAPRPCFASISVLNKQTIRRKRSCSALIKNMRLKCEMR